MTDNAHAKRESFATRKTRAAEGEIYELQADAIKALAHPGRLMLVDLLSDGSELTVSQLQSDTGMSQSNVSQNLAILRTAGLLNARRDGNNIYYSVSDPRVLKAVALLRAVLETQFQDKRLLVERKAFKTKEAIKRTTIMSSIIGVGLLVAVTLGAISHPLWLGGDLVDVGQHAEIMFMGGSIDAMAQACADVITEPVLAAPSSSGMAA